MIYLARKRNESYPREKYTFKIMVRPGWLLQIE